MNDVVKFFSIFTPKQIRECFFIFVAIVIGAALESIGIGAILPLITLMENPEIISENIYVYNILCQWGINSQEKLLIVVAMSLCLLYILKNIYITWEVYIQRAFVKRVEAMYAKELLATYLAKPYAFHINNNSAVLLRNVSNGPSMIFSGMLMPFFYIISEFITVIAIWILLLAVDAIIAIAVVVIMGIIVFSVTQSFKKMLIDQGMIQKNSIADYLKWVNQSIGGIKETKILGCENFFLNNFAKSYNKYVKAYQICGFLGDIPRIITELIVVSSVLFLIIFKIVFAGSHSEIVPVLGVLAMAAFRLMPSANRIISYYTALKNKIPFFNEIYDSLLEIKERLLIGDNFEQENSNIDFCFKNIIKVDNVSFSYQDNGEMIFDRISFHIHKGDFVGIVGPSGAGKTTLVDILLGLLKPTSGRILCDDNDLSENIRAWQGNLAYVPQDIYLLDGTIRENIALGVSPNNIDDYLINKVLSMAELNEYIVTLPYGLDTFVGERGVKISGGQRQRIGIARALYHKPEVLILDEATSALDSETEKAITDTILKLKGQITIIAIAHRVSTLEACDYKIKLENGKAEILQG